MLLRRGILAEFRLRVARHVDLAPESVLAFPQGGRQVGQSEVADHEQIDVTLRMLLTACDRPVDEGRGYSRLERPEQVAQRRHHAGRLLDETVQLGK